MLLCFYQECFLEYISALATWIYYFAPGRCSEYCKSMSVCQSVCLSVCLLSQKHTC